MKVYTARQAIFNRKQVVIAYELLFRDGPENFYPDIDHHEATSKLIMRTHLNQGLENITAGKPALINFGEESILNEVPLLLPKEKVMIEILETVTPSDEVFEKCRALFHQGYKLALDDFIYKPEWNRFFKFIRLVKFDIMQNPLTKIAPLVEKLKQLKNVKILAEKVETQAEYEQAHKMGFDYFQGYFFCKPEMKEKRDVEGNPQALMNLYQESMKAELDVQSLSAYFEQDLGLSYKLLRFINSGVMPVNQEISSIRQALVYLGAAQTRKLIALMVTSVLAQNKPRELVKIAIIRARFCELMATKGYPGLVDSAFLTGLFSLLDAILNQPMGEALAQLPLDNTVVIALTEDSQTPLAIMLRAIKYYEQGSWYNTQRESTKVKVDYELMSDYYQDSIKWAEAV